MVRSKRPQARRRGRGSAGDGGRSDGGGPAYWLYGRHAVAAAAANPRRRLLRLVAVADVAPPDGGARTATPEVERLDRAALAALLPPDAVHQGLAALVAPLPPVALEDACQPRPDAAGIVVLLDQVSDPRNVGAVLRSAAAFGARAVVVPERHAPAESAAMAKAASGALERVPLVRVTNLARALDRLAQLGYWRYGLAAGAGPALDSLELARDCVLVLGAEGEGLRRLTAENCDLLARLPMSPGSESLNVSAAAAVALYIAWRATTIA